MFSIILKNCGFRRTFTPLIVQTREFKREGVSYDLNIEHLEVSFEEEKKEDKLPKLWVNNNFGLDIPDGTYIHQFNL